MRHDPVLSRPTRGPRGERAGPLAAALRRLRATPARGYAGAALTAVLVGIVINALTFQHVRHPAPFFAPPPLAATATPAPAAARVPTAPPTMVAPPPPTRPADLGGADAAAANARNADAIGDLLRADADKDAQKTLLAAQNALVKLGYPVKADGAPSPATTAALRDFERVHSLPLSNDVTSRLLKQLAAAAAAR
jgi:peptidoglycan hydrolase-like protein with peptidoglycan-binding domain